MKIIALFLVMAISLMADDAPKDCFHICGHVIQKLPDGYLVQSDGPKQISPPIRQDNGFILQPATYEQFKYPAVRVGPLFVTSKKDLVDGDPVQMDVTVTGTFSYTDTTGAQATVRKYAELPPPKPVADKDKPFNPGSMNP